LCSGFGQAIYTSVVCASVTKHSSIIWYRPRGWSLWLGK